MGAENSAGPHKGESQLCLVHSYSLELFLSLSLTCCEWNGIPNSSAQGRYKRQGNCYILVKLFTSVKQFWTPNSKHIKRPNLLKLPTTCFLQHICTKTSCAGPLRAFLLDITMFILIQ